MTSTIPSSPSSSSRLPAIRHSRSAVTSPASWRASQSDDDAFTKMPTALVTLTPDFLAALKKVAPKKRRSRARWVVACALLAVVAVLGFSRSAREVVITKGRPVVARISARLHHAPAAAPAAAAPAAVAAVPAAPAAAPAAQGDEASSIAAVLASTSASAPTSTPEPPPAQTSAPVSEPAPPVVAAPVVMRDEAPAASTSTPSSSEHVAPAKATTKKPAAKKGQRRASGSPSSARASVSARRAT